MVPLPRDEPEGLVGEVLWVDHFGNCQLNVGPDEIAGWGDRVQVAFGESTRVVARHAHVRRRRQLAPSVWWSTAAGCWRWCSTSARRRRSWASGPATRSRWRRSTDAPAAGATSPVTLRAR